MRIDNEKQKMQKMQATIAALWATYRRMRKDGVIGDVPLRLSPMRKEDQLVKYGDENGLIFAPTCNPSNDSAKNALTAAKLSFAVIRRTIPTQRCRAICHVPFKMVAQRVLRDQVREGVLHRPTILRRCPRP